jgi:hypothetical protein
MLTFPPPGYNPFAIGQFSLVYPAPLKDAYLINDSFLDSRAPGTVNGTPLTPGPGPGGRFSTDVTQPPRWTANTPVAYGAFCRDAAGNYYQCGQAGITGVSEPSWITSIGWQTIDNTVHWRRFCNPYILNRCLRVYPTFAQNMKIIWSEIPIAKIPGIWMLAQFSFYYGGWQLGLHLNLAESIPFLYLGGADDGYLDVPFKDSSFVPVLTAPDNSQAIHYQVALVCRKFGGLYFCNKNSAGLRLLYTTTWSNDRYGQSPILPLLNWGSSYGDDRYAQIENYLRMPTQFWPLTIGIIAADTFVRSNGTLGLTDGKGHQLALLVPKDNSGDDPQAGQGNMNEAVAGNGLPWTNLAGTVQIVGNTAQSTALSGGRAVCVVPVGTNNVFMTMALAALSTGGAGLVFDCVDANNYWYWFFDGSNLKLIQRVNGVDQAPASTVAASFTAKEEMRLRLDGTNFWSWYKNIMRVADLTISKIGGNYAGLIFFDTGTQVNEFVCRATGNEGQYNYISNFNQIDNSYLLNEDGSYILMEDGSSEIVLETF